MRTFRNILALGLAVVMLLCSTALADTLRVGMECNYAPFNWTQAEESEYAVPIATTCVSRAAWRTHSAWSLKSSRLNGTA